MPDTFEHVFTGQTFLKPPRDCQIIGERSGSSFWLGPALFDPQVNGFAGVDFQRAEILLDDVERAVMALREQGCWHILLTLITAEADFLTEQFKRLAGYIERSSLLQDAVLGFHLEGPFLSSDKGFIGAHPRDCAIDPDWDLFQRWQEAAGGRITMLTLAPERSGSIEVIRKATESGVFVCLGHSDASLDQLKASIDAGARLFTHLGNGCPAEMHRHDNIIQRVLSLEPLMVSLIPDGHHLPPWVLESWLRILETARAILTTDAISAAGAPSGRYTLGRLEVETGADGVVRLPGTRQFAGSSLGPAQGLANAMELGGLDPASAWRAWTRLRDELFPGTEPPQIAVKKRKG